MSNINEISFDTSVDDVWKERLRQEKLKAEGRFAHTLADAEMPDVDRIAALGEEYGEVCRALMALNGSVQESTHSRANDRTELRKELIQVCAVAFAWIEHLDNERDAEGVD